MASSARGGGGLAVMVVALALGAWVASGLGPAARGADGAPGPGAGTLGYGGPGVYPGFPGFGLGYGKGYGYGGSGLGVGAQGGYPYYAGPGYPHGVPPLRRFGPATPFTFYGGPADGRLCFNMFGAVRPLVVDRPIVLETDGQDSGFGQFTGVLDYPEALFAPYASAAATTGTVGEAPSRGLPAVTPLLVPAGHPLGIDEEPVVDPDRVRGIRVARVYPGSAADKAGLKVGDVIRSTNGYLTTQTGNLTWIIANQAQGHLLEMVVRSAADGNVRVIRAQLPVLPVNTSRPGYLPPVGNGPPPASR